MKRALLVNLTILVVSCAAGLAAVEGVLSLRRPRAVIGRLPPGERTFVHHEFLQRSTANRYGLRRSGFAPRRGTHNVLVLGDSFVEGTGQADEETMVWLLNQHFADQRYQFFNAGISGTDISDHRETYRAVIEAVDVDFASALVVLFLGNDFLDYERLPYVKRPRERPNARPPESRLALRIASAIVPNTLASLKAARGSRVGAVPQEYSARTHIDWFNANLRYFDRGPMSEEEVARLRERFDRIPARSRALIREGRLNMWTYHAYVTEPLNDFVYNMDSPYNERIFQATTTELGRLIDAIDVPVVVVLIPDKIQVSEVERAVARAIIDDPAYEEELHVVLEVNARLVRWLAERYPDVPVWDATPDLIARGAQDFYYTIDGHMRPAGARLVAEGILSVYP